MRTIKKPESLDIAKKLLDKDGLRKYNRVSKEVATQKDNFSIFNNKVVRIIINQIEKGVNVNRDLFNNMEITIPSSMFVEVFGNTNFKNIAKNLSKLQEQGLFEYNEETKQYEGFKPFYYTRYFESEKQAVVKIVKEAVIKIAELNQGGYAEYELANYLDLGSYYSQRIYELLSTQRKNKIWIVTEKDLRVLLRCENKYVEYKSFHRDIIEKAKKEIEEKTELGFTYDWSKGKEGRVYKFILHIKEISRTQKDFINEQVEWFKKLPYYDQYCYTKESILPQFNGLSHAEKTRIGNDSELMVKTWELHLKFSHGMYKATKSKAAYLRKVLGIEKITVQKI